MTTSEAQLLYKTLHHTSQCVIHVEAEKFRLLQVKTSVDEDSKSNNARKQLSRRREIARRASCQSLENY